jgi:hypothetical protein
MRKSEMINPSYLTVITLIASLLFNTGAIAAEPREITWDDLVPAEAEFDDAFTKLDEDTIFELSMVAGVRDRLEAGQKVDENTLANYRKRVEGLEQDGVDVDGLIAMREQITEERIAKTYLANKELDGNTPPPPPNQIVHVKTDDAYTTDGGLYTPVWVNGLMKTEQTQANLDFIDGASDIPSAYALEAISVEPYE